MKYGIIWLSDDQRSRRHEQLPRIVQPIDGNDL